MTGQVKEDILARMGELGIDIINGRINFHPTLLRKKEFLKEINTFEYYDVKGEFKSIDLPINSMVFTYCQIPIIYHMSEKKLISIKKEKDLETIEGNSINANDSSSIFNRKGEIQWIQVNVTID